MRTLIGIALAILLLLGFGIGPGSSPAPRSMRGDVFTKGENGKPAVLPEARIVPHEPVTKGTESDTQGAFAVDVLPSRTHEIEVNAPGLHEVLAVKVSAGRCSTLPVELNRCAVTTTTSPQLTGLKAMDRAFSRKVYYA